MKAKAILVRHHFNWLDVGSWISALQRLVTRSYYNHTALAVITESGGLWVYEAQFKGVVKLTWQEWLDYRPNKEWIIGDCKKPINWFKVDASVGLPYDIKSWFQQLIYITFKIWIGSKGQSHVNCCEVMAWYWQLPNAYKWLPQDFLDSPLFKWNTEINQTPI